MEAGDNLLPSGVSIHAQSGDGRSLPGGQSPPQVATDDPLLSNAEQMSQEDDSDDSGGEILQNDNDDTNTNAVNA